MYDVDVVTSANVKEFINIAYAYKQTVLNTLAAIDPDDHSREMKLSFQLRELKRFLKYCLDFNKSFVEPEGQDVGSEL